MLPKSSRSAKVSWLDQGEVTIKIGADLVSSDVSRLIRRRQKACLDQARSLFQPNPKTSFSGNFTGNLLKTRLFRNYVA
jgi:hypothetical protein